MIAYITETGKLKIIAENTTEDYALKHWAKNSLVYYNDTENKETQFVRGSRIELIRSTD